MIAALPLIAVFARLSGLMTEGRQLLFRHCMWFGQPDLIVALAIDRLRSFERRMQSLFARWLAGKLKPRRRPAWPRKPMPPPSDDDPPKDKPVRLPRGFGWLNKRIMPDGFITADKLNEWLANPEMLAWIAATPQAGRLLRPICQMYGIKLDAIALPKRERRKPAPTPAQRARQAEREEAKRQRELAKTSSKKSVVPKGHTYPVTERDWAIWARRNKRNERRWRAARKKSA